MAESRAVTNRDGNMCIHGRKMDLLTGSLLLRPYVFLFLAAFFVASTLDLGLRRTLLFGALVAPMAWAAEVSSIHVGIPFGLYNYTGLTRGQELYVAGIPFFDPLSFIFLAYAAYCLARRVTRRWASPTAQSGPSAGFAGAIESWGEAVRSEPQASDERRKGGEGPLRVPMLAGFFMMMLDVVIDPVAVRGARWFLGDLFYYPGGGVYFGVPLSNFAGWWLVGAIGVFAYETCAGAGRGRGVGRVDAGIALYYAVFVFNLAVTGWIREWTLAVVGLALHALMALAVVTIARRTPRASLAGTRGAERV